MHVPFTFYPDSVGGTEVYVGALSRNLQQFGVSSSIAAPSSQNDTYEYQGIRVYRYALKSKPYCIRELYGEGDQIAAKSFDRIFAAEAPDLLHLHAFTPGVSLQLVKAAKAHRIPVVFTYHTPTITCQRGTMMLWGMQPCDGLLDLHRCARCTIHGLLRRGSASKHESGDFQLVAQRLFAHLIGSTPPALGKGLGLLNLQGTHWTALRMTELIQLRHTTVRSLFEEVNHVVAVCQWVKDLLLFNGVPRHKVTLCPQGAPEEVESQNGDMDPLRARPGSSLQIAFLGRLHPTKGVHILIEALRLIPEARLRLVIYGMEQGGPAGEYERQLRRLAAPDRRIEFRAPIPSSAINLTLRNFDLLAVPSQGLETGPLVVLEAFAAGLPVIGSRLGGISELIKHGVDGILVDPSKIKDWATQLRRLSEDVSVMHRLRKGVRRPRTMSNVAKDMRDIYDAVLPRDTTPRPALALAQPRR